MSGEERECRYPCDCGQFPDEHCACMDGHASSPAVAASLPVTLARDVIEPLVPAVERIVAERVRVVEGERDAWEQRRDAAVEQCRHLHQDGKTREQWHLDNCGAMRALAELRARVEALAEEWEADFMAFRKEDPAHLKIRALLGGAS